MNWDVHSLIRHGLILTSTLAFPAFVHAQNSVTATQPQTSVTILDSTKEQDGLNGSVRRVKTESAKLELRKGQLVESARRLMEITTYDISGKRIENVSYPVESTSIGKEEYKYDDRGNMVEMTLRGDDGSILSKEAYTYEFDKFGNWTKMVTSLVVFEGGELKKEPTEISYRSITYYFGDSVAKMVDSPTRTTDPSPKSSDSPARFNDSTTATVNDAPVKRNEAPIKTYEPPPKPKMPVIPSAGDSPISLENGPNRLTSNERASGQLVSMSEPPPEIAKPKKVKKVSTAMSEERRDSQPNEVTAASATASPLTGRSGTNQPALNSHESEKPTSSPRSDSSSGTAAAAKTASNVTAPAVTPEQKNAYELFKKGRDLFDLGDLKGAVALYLESIAIEPRSAEVQLSLGHAYLQLKKDKEASKAFTQSLLLNPNLTEAYYGLGLAAFRMGKHRDAATAFKRAVDLRPDLAKAHYGLALAYQELRNEDGLVEQYRILQTLDRGLAKQLARAFPEFDLPCRVPPFCK